jgi:hypothetical protein
MQVSCETDIQQPLSSWEFFPAVPALDLCVLAWPASESCG